MRKSSLIYVDVHKSYLDSGEPLWLLKNKQEQEILPLTLLYSVERRNEAASSTIETEMRGIAYLYEHAFRQGFPLDAYLRLSPFDTPSLVNFIRSLFVYLQTGESNENVAGAVHSRIAPATFAGYWNIIKGYVMRWIEWSLVKNKFDKENDVETLCKNILHLEDRFSQFVSRTPPKLHLPVLHENDLNKVIKAFHPDSDTFKDETVKWRNWTIFLLLLDSGIRIGELLNLYVSDIPRGRDAMISITRRPDNPADPRARPARVKSRSRKITVSNRTIATLNQYITDYRSDHAGVAFLFLDDESNKPLAYSTVKSAFDTVGENTGIKVKPHTLRHTRHYNRLLEMGLQKGKDIVCFEGGWSPVSGIPETYIYQYKLDQSNKTAPFFLDNLIKRVKRDGKDSNQ